MSSYIKGIISDFRLAYARFLLGAQRFLGGSLVTGLEDALADARKKLDKALSANATIIRRNRDLQVVVDRRNERGNKEALILGRHQRGEVVADTALAFDTVVFPTLGVTAKVHGSSLIINDIDPLRPVVVYSNMHRFSMDLEYSEPLTLDFLKS